MKNTKIKDYFNGRANGNCTFTYDSDYCQYNILRDEYSSEMINLTTYRLIRYEAYETFPY